MEEDRTSSSHVREIVNDISTTASNVWTLPTEKMTLTSLNEE